MNYYIYLDNVKRWIKESNDDRIWLLTDNVNEAFSDSDLSRIKKVASFISHDKNIPLHDIIIEREIITITTERFNLDDDYELCPVCLEWVHVDNMVYASYDSEVKICVDCKGDGN